VIHIRATYVVQKPRLKRYEKKSSKNGESVTEQAVATLIDIRDTKSSKQPTVSRLFIRI